MKLAQYYDLISDDDLMPSESRAIYLKEMKIQGDSPMAAMTRLEMRLAGLRERKAIQMYLADGGRWMHDGEESKTDTTTIEEINEKWL